MTAKAAGLGGAAGCRRGTGDLSLWRWSLVPEPAYAETVEIGGGAGGRLRDIGVRPHDAGVEERLVLPTTDYERRFATFFGYLRRRAPRAWRRRRPMADFGSSGRGDRAGGDRCASAAGSTRRRRPTYRHTPAAVVAASQSGADGCCRAT